MGSGLFKALELQRQLQEKAKIIAQKKVEADAIFQRITELIDSGKKMNILQPALIDGYNEIVKLYQKSSYDDVITQCNELMPTIEDTYRAGYQQFNQSIKDRVAQFSKLGRIEVDNRDAEALMNKGSWKEATISMYELEKKAIEHIESNINKIMQHIANKIDLLNDTEKQKAMGLSKEIVNSIKNKKLTEVLSKLDDLYTSVYRDELRKIDDYKNKINELIEIKTELNYKGGILDISHISNENYVNPDELIKELDDTYEVLEKETYQIVNEQVEQLSNRYELAIGEGIESELTAIALKKIKELLKSNDLTAILLQIKMASTDLKKQVNNKFAVEIEKIKNDLVTAKKMGMDLTGIVELLNNGRELLSSGSFSSAFEKVKVAREQLKTMLFKVKEIRENIDEVEGIISSLNALGVNTSDSNQLLEDAIKSINKLNFSEADALLYKSKELAWKVAENKIVAIMEEAQKVEKDAKQLGANTELITEQIKHLTEDIKNKEIRKAILVARGLNIESKEVMKRYIQSLISEIENNISKNNDFMERWNNDIKLAKDEFDRGNYIKSVEIANKIKNELDEEFKKDENAILDDLKELIEYSKSVNIDVAMFKENFDQIVEMYHKGKYLNAGNMAYELKHKIHKIISKLISREFTLAKLSVIEAKKVGVKVDALKKSLESVQTLTEKGNYRGAIEVINKVKADSIAARENNQKAVSEISKAANIISDVKIYGINVQSYIAKLYEAKDAFDKSEYEESINIARSISNDCIKSLNQFKITNKMRELEDRIKEIEKYGIEPDQIKSIVEEAKKLVESEDYTGALSTLEWGEQTALQIIKDGFILKISALEKEISYYKSLGIYVGDSEDNIKNARISMDTGLYERSLEIILQEKENLRKVKEEYEKATDALKKARAIINSAEAIKVDVSNAKGTILKINELIKDHMYSEAVQYAESTIEIVKKQALSHVNGVIVSLSNLIMKAKTTGRNTMLAENLQSRALNALAKRDYMEAFNYAMRCEGELEKVELQYMTASGTVAMSESKINELENNGFVLNDARALINKAKELLMKGDYVSALDYAIQVGDNLNTVVEVAKQAAVLIQNARDRMNFLYKIGVNIEDAANIFNKAKEEMAKGSYQESINYANKTVDEVTLSINRFVSNIENSITEMLNIAEKLGVDAISAKQLFIEAKSSIATQNFERVIDTLNIAKERLDALLKDRFNTELQKIKDLVQRLETDGIAVTSIKGEFSKIQDMIEASRFNELFDVVTVLNQKIVELEKNSIKDDLARFEKAIIFTENTGLDMTEFMELLIQYKLNYNAGAYDGLLYAIKKSMSKLNDTIVDLVKTKLEEFKSTIEMSRAKGILINNAEKSYAIAKTLLEKNESIEAYDEITNGINIISKSAEEKNKIIMLSVMAEDIINKANNEDMDISKAVEMLEQASKISMTNYEKAIEILNNISSYIVTKKDENQETPKASVQFYSPEQGTTAGAEQCFACKGKLKSGMSIIVCNTCHTKYHETCAKRIKNCMVCGTQLV